MANTTLACLLILNLAIALGLFLHSHTTAARAIFAGAVVLLGIPLLYTYSRTSFVAILAASLLFGVLKDRRLLVVTVIVGLITPVIAPAAIMDRISTIAGVATGNEPSSWSSRLFAWQSLGGKALSESPLVQAGATALAPGEVGLPTAADQSMAMQVGGDRMPAVTGALPPDSLRAMIRRINAEMRSK